METHYNGIHYDERSKEMKIYRISQDTNTGYDTFSEAIVSAPNELTAKMTHPSQGYQNIQWWTDEMVKGVKNYKREGWCHYSDVNVELLGYARPEIGQGVISSSFHAG